MLVFLLVIHCVSAQQSEILTPMWTYDLKGSIEEQITLVDAWVEDIDNDGYGEVVVVTSGRASTKYADKVNIAQAFERDGSLKWSYGIKEPLMYAKLFDINNDHKMELIFTSGEELNKIQRGYIRTLSDEGKLLRSTDLTSIILSMDIGDIDGDRYYELAVGSFGKIMLKRTYYENIWSYPSQGNGVLNSSIDAITLYDVDGMFGADVIAGSDKIYYISEVGNLLASINVEPEITYQKRGFKYVKGAKITGSTYSDTIAVTKSNKIVAVGIDKVQGKDDGRQVVPTLKWKTDLKCDIIDFELLNIDSDDYDELIIACSDNTLYAVDNNGMVAWDYPLDGEPTDISIADMNEDNIKDILVATSTGSIYLIDSSGNYVWRYDTKIPLTAVAAGHMDLNDTREIIAVTESGKLMAYSIDEGYNMRRRAEAAYNFGQQAYLMSDYDAAEKYFEQAKNIYTLLQDERGMINSQSFLSKISQAKTDVRREDADIYLSRARDSFFEGELTNSKIMAGRALTIYTEFSDQDGILKCELLLIEIEKQEGLYKSSTTITLKPTITTLPQDFSSSANLIYLATAVAVVLLIGLILRSRTRNKKTESIDQMGWGEEFLDEDKKTKDNKEKQT